MRFSEVMHSIRREGDMWTGSLSEDWLQGRSAFGGIQVAMALRAMRALLPDSTPLRSLQVAFIAPIPAGAISISAKVLRQGKSVTQIEARLLDGNDTACLVIGVFGAPRESKLHRLPAQPVIESTAKPTELRYVPGGPAPQFMQHFQARWLSGDLPFTGSTKTEQVIDISLKDDGVADEEHVVAFADFIPPIGLSMLDKPTPGSSLSWMLEIFADSRGLSLDHWRIDASLHVAQDGYTSQQVMLWGPGGEPVALSRQSMVVFG